MKRFYNIHEAATYTGMPEKTLYVLGSKRLIPRIKRGRTVLFDRLDLDSFLLALKQPAKSPGKAIRSIVDAAMNTR